jgi:predicted Zn-dependent peptidase
LTVTEPLLLDGGLTLVFPAANGSDPDAAALDLIVLLLSGIGPWSLENALVRQNAIAESVTTELRRADLASHVYIEMQLRPGVSPERAESVVDDLMARWASFADAGALREARTSFIVDSLLDIEDPLDRAFRHLDCLRSFGEPFQFGKHVQRYRSVTLERARTAARRFLNPRARLAARHVDGGRSCAGVCISHDSEGPE